MRYFLLAVLDGGSVICGTYHFVWQRGITGSRSELCVSRGFGGTCFGDVVVLLARLAGWLAGWPSHREEVELMRAALAMRLVACESATTQLCDCRCDWMPHRGTLPFDLTVCLPLPTTAMSVRRLGFDDRALASPFPGALQREAPPALACAVVAVPVVRWAFRRASAASPPLHCQQTACRPRRQCDRTCDDISHDFPQRKQRKQNRKKKWA